jgi:hypothetical protein
LPVIAPLNQIFATLRLALSTLLFFLFLAFKQLALTGLCLSKHTLNSFALFIVQILFTR